MKRPAIIKIIFIIIAMHAFVLNVCGQDTVVTNKFSCGGAAGFRIYSGLVFAQYKVAPPVAISIQFSDNFYIGPGISAGVTGYFLQHAKYKPLVNIFYLRSTGSAFSYDRDNNMYTAFKTKDANYIVPMIGVSRDVIETGEYKYKHYFCFELKVGYKISNTVFPGVEITEGPAYPSKQAQIERRVNNSVVASFGLMCNLLSKVHSYK